jgi:hypothetical protein
MVRCRRCGRHALVGALQARVGQLCHRAGVAAPWRQPSGSPRQCLPAANVTGWCFSGAAAPHRAHGPPQPASSATSGPVPCFRYCRALLHLAEGSAGE